MQLKTLFFKRVGIFEFNYKSIIAIEAATVLIVLLTAPCFCLCLCKFFFVVVVFRFAFIVFFFLDALWIAAQ